MGGKPQCVCGKCRKNITKSQYSKQCEKCKLWFHLTCARLSEVDAEVIKKLQSKWFCDSCKTITEKEVRKSIGERKESTPQPSASNDNSTTITEVLRQLFELKREVEGLKVDVQFYSEKYDEQILITKALNEEIKTLKKENGKINMDLAKFKSQTKIKDLEKRQNNIVIMGLKNNCAELKDRPEEVKQKSRKVLSYIDPDLEFENVEIKPVNVEKENTPILVAFKNPQEKNAFLTKRKEKGNITSTKCNLPGSHSIYVNEDMSREQRELFRRARSLRDRGYKFVWSKGGNIYVRRTETSDIVRINCSEDIDELEQQD